MQWKFSTIEIENTLGKPSLKILELNLNESLTYCLLKKTIEEKERR